MRSSIYVALVCANLGWLTACGREAVSGAEAGSKAPAVQPAAAPATSPLTTTEAQAKLYRKAFPDADAFVVKRVSADALPVEDKGNDTYVEVRDKEQRLLGYVRDFNGPVSTDANCLCSPLSLTLVFGPDLRFRTLLSEAPLEKLGHEAMTAEDTARLIEIVKNPPKALLDAPRAADMVDGVSGATKNQYKEMVVEQAALSTRRITGLARDTGRLISGGALERDRAAIRVLLEGESDPGRVANKLASFLPKAESPDVRAQAYEGMWQWYAQSLLRKSPPDRAVEERLLEGAKDRSTDLAKACQGFASEKLVPTFVQECIRRLSPGSNVDPTTWALLRGTAAFAAGSMADAVSGLRSAAAAISHDQDPQLHLRLVQALKAQNQMEEACRRVKPLYRDHSRLPGVEPLLSVCGGSTEALASELREERRKLVLAKRQPDGAPAPSLTVLDQGGLSREMSLAGGNKATVLIVFAAWCPHCQSAFPQFKEVAATVAKDPKLREKVRVMGVRTYTEREQEPWSSFLQRFAPNFEVWTDGAQGASLRSFAQRYGFPGSIPRLLVLDSKGVLRYVIDSAGHPDLASELLWTAEAVAQ